MSRSAATVALAVRSEGVWQYAQPTLANCWRPRAIDSAPPGRSGDGGGGQTLTLAHFAADAGTPVPPLPRGLRDALREFERQHVRDVLVEAGFDKRAAARLLRISLASLYRKLA